MPPVSAPAFALPSIHPQRSAPTPRDQSLSSVAHAWWRSLPTVQQPHELCILYPRVANRIALCWNDVELTERLFASLMVDQRGGRKGFPKDVLAELLMLRELLTLRTVRPAPAAAAATESAPASVPVPS